MAERLEKIIDIKVNYDKAVEKITRYRLLVEDLKKQEKELKEQVKNGEITQKEYTSAIIDAKVAQKEYSAIISDVTKAIKNQQTKEQEEADSLKSLRAELSLLTREYDSLSSAERDSAKGKELQNKINTTTEILKVNEEATSRYYRNVGNYENSIINAFNKLNPKLEEARKKYLALLQAEGAQSKATQEARDNMEKLQNTATQLNNVQLSLNNSIINFISGGNSSVASMINMAGGMGNLSNAFMVAKTSVAAFGKQLLALLANPIVLILGGIAAAVMAVSKAIQSSEALTNRMRVAMAPLNVVVDAFMNILTETVGVILSFVEAGGKLLQWTMDAAEALPVVGDSIKKVNDAVKERVDLQKSQIEYEQKVRAEIVESAKRERDIAALREKATDKENYSAAERKKSLEAAMQLEKESAEARKKLAEFKLKNLQREAALTENDAEMNNKLAEAEAEVISTDRELSDVLRSSNRERSRLSKELKAEAEAAAKTVKEQKKKELEETRKAEDALTRLIMDEAEKRKKQTELSYDRQIEDLKIRLSTEKNLTAKAREQMNLHISALEQEKMRALSRLSEEEMRKDIETRQRIIQNTLETVKKGSDEEYALKQEQLLRERDLMLQNTELTEAERLSVIQKYQALELELRNQHTNDIINKQTEAIRLRYETELATEHDNEMEKSRIMVEYKKELWENAQQQEGETLAEYQLRSLNLQNDYFDAQKELADKEVEINDAKASAIANAMGEVGSAISAVSDESAAAVAASKILALAEVAINQGTAIAKVLSAEASKGLPGIMTAIASVSSIIAAFASAIKSIKSAKVNTSSSSSKKKGYATGGLVTGQGSGTSDSIDARLSNGESVITARATSMFAPILSAFNTMGGGIPIPVHDSNQQAVGEDMIARAVAKGLKYMPRPVVSVEEISNVGNRVETIESISRL